MKNYNRPQKDEGNRVEIGVSKSINMKKRKYQKPKNMSDPNFYNPAAIKKQREFYKNAKCVSKFNKWVKREAQQIDSKGVDSSENTSSANNRNESRDNKAKYSLGEIYKKKSEELEKERKEREAIIKAKNEERQAKEARRKADKAKMFKKTRHGQPIMKYRIERLLESIQGSQKAAAREI